MNGKSIGVAAALLAGGGALYGGYQLVDGRGDAMEADVAESAEVPGLPDARAALVGLEDDFDGGADGGDATRAPGEDAPVVADRPRGLRGAPAEDLAEASDDTDDDTSVERLLADIAASSSGVDEAATNSPRLGGTAGRTDASTRSSTAYAANARLTDKPDEGGYAANRHLTDKLDQGGYVASADTQRFDPCEKADGTTYVGPGTALNPFAETDPCLPQATAQGYQVAQLASPVDPELPLEPMDPATGLVAVDVARPRVPPPPPAGTGSDYRG